MVWTTTISWNYFDPIAAPLHGRINSKDYLNILGNHVHSMVQTLFPDSDVFFQDDDAPIRTADVV